MYKSKRSYVLESDLIHVIKKLPKEKIGDLLLTILSFINDENPVIDDLLVEVVFEPIKQDLIRQYNINPKGIRHWNWKDGKTSENQLIRNGSGIREWRKEVFSRDKYTCQKCHQIGGTLHAHHIKYFSLYPELRFDIDNGLTLCKKCHNNEHRKNNILSTVNNIEAFKIDAHA